MKIILKIFSLRKLQDGSNEGSQQMFSVRNIKKLYLLIILLNPLYLEFYINCMYKKAWVTVLVVIAQFRNVCCVIISLKSISCVVNVRELSDTECVCTHSLDKPNLGRVKMKLFVYIFPWMGKDLDRFASSNLLNWDWLLFVWWRKKCDLLEIGLPLVLCNVSMVGSSYI